jgi:hypothetical protein
MFIVCSFHSNTAVHANTYSAFLSACSEGHLDIVKWLWSLPTFVKPAKPKQIEHAFHQYACREGHVETAQWLLSKGRIDIHFEEDTVFLDVCRDDCGIEAARWLVSLQTDYPWPLNTVAHPPRW